MAEKVKTEAEQNPAEDQVKTKAEQNPAEDQVKTKAEQKETEDQVKTKAEQNPADDQVKTELKKIKFLLPPAGQFLLPYNVGQVVELPANQADEIVEAKYAEFVK